MARIIKTSKSIALLSLKEEASQHSTIIPPRLYFFDRESCVGHGVSSVTYTNSTRPLTYRHS